MKKDRLLLYLSVLLAVFCLGLTACAERPEEENVPTTLPTPSAVQTSTVEPAPTPEVSVEATPTTESVSSLSKVQIEMKNISEDHVISEVPEGLVAALNGAAESLIDEKTVIEGGYISGTRFPHWGMRVFYRAEEESTTRGNPSLKVQCGIAEDIVQVMYSRAGTEECVYVENGPLYWLLRSSNDREETVDQNAFLQFEDILVSQMEQMLAQANDDFVFPEAFACYEVTQFYPLWQFEEANGCRVELYDFEFALVPKDPLQMTMSGGAYLDSKLRLNGYGPGQFAARYRDGELVCTAFMGNFYFSMENDPHYFELAKNKTTSALNLAQLYADSKGMTAEDLRAVLLAYRAFLQGRVDCIEMGSNQVLNVSDLGSAVSSDNGSVKIDQFSIIDLDDDGSPETVLRLNVNGGGFYILRYQNGAVYGDAKVYRGLMDLKADGTFSYSSGAFDHGFGTLTFGPEGWLTQKITYCESVNGPAGDMIGENFVVEGKPATGEEFSAALSKQGDKPDVVWYDFTEENVNEQLSG